MHRPEPDISTQSVSVHNKYFPLPEEIAVFTEHNRHADSMIWPDRDRIKRPFIRDRDIAGNSIPTWVNCDNLPAAARGRDTTYAASSGLNNLACRSDLTYYNVTSFRAPRKVVKRLAGTHLGVSTWRTPTSLLAPYASRCTNLWAACVSIIPEVIGGQHRV